MRDTRVLGVEVHAQGQRDTRAERHTDIGTHGQRSTRDGQRGSTLAERHSDRGARGCKGRGSPEVRGAHEHRSHEARGQMCTREEEHTAREAHWQRGTRAERKNGIGAHK
jgi:hypothetical protein